MFEAAQNNLENDLGLHCARYKRIALNLTDIHKYNLPNDPEAVKKTDRRYQAFVNQYGEYAVELDELHPRELKSIAVSAVESEVDMKLAKQQVELEKKIDEKIVLFQTQLKTYAEKLLEKMNV